MSSHREAPEISKDPVADNTDVYAFRSPDAPSTVTLIANFIPFQVPWGGPNFSEFGDDVVYGINISNRDGAKVDVRYEFRFKTTIRNPATFLYNTGQIKSITDPTWNRPQTYSITKTVRIRGDGDTEDDFKRAVIATGLLVPPCNVGIRSTPDYASLAAQAVHALPGGRTVFAGQRGDPFFVDLGSIFDLGALRPFNSAHLIPLPTAQAVNGLQGLNVHTIALRVPIAELTASGTLQSDVMSRDAVIGVWANTTRMSGSVRNDDGSKRWYGKNIQVSRLGNPLFNEVLTPMARKDYWNSQQPRRDSQFAQYVDKPELQGLLPALYPGVFPNLAAYKKPRADLDAILLTGLPAGVIPGFQNYTGATKADMLRLNVAVPPASNPNPLGLIAGDAAGFPNGRRPMDDSTTVELRAIGGLTIPLVDPSYQPDGAVGAIPAQPGPAGGITDGTSNTNAPLPSGFPYVGLPAGGYQSTPGTPVVA